MTAHHRLTGGTGGGERGTAAPVRPRLLVAGAGAAGAHELAVVRRETSPWFPATGSALLADGAARTET
jgi:hypothetical protein